MIQAGGVSALVSHLHSALGDVPARERRVHAESPHLRPVNIAGSTCHGMRVGRVALLHPVYLTVFVLEYLHINAVVVEGLRQRLLLIVALRFVAVAMANAVEVAVPYTITVDQVASLHLFISICLRPLRVVQPCGTVGGYRFHRIGPRHHVL